MQRQYLTNFCPMFPSISFWKQKPFGYLMLPIEAEKKWNVNGFKRKITGTKPLIRLRNLLLIVKKILMEPHGTHWATKPFLVSINFALYFAMWAVSFTLSTGFHGVFHTVSWTQMTKNVSIKVGVERFLIQPQIVKLKKPFHFDCGEFLFDHVDFKGLQYFSNQISGFWVMHNLIGGKVQRFDNINLSAFLAWKLLKRVNNIFYLKLVQTTRLMKPAIPSMRPWPYCHSL